jgi:GT2 family glycosyltransferase
VRYFREPRLGLDWARNRAILEARGEIIAFTDDDALPDADWVRSLAAVFAEDAAVMAVTGLVVPYELETEAQILFEQYGGFGRGFQRTWYRLDSAGRERWRFCGAGQFGTGANMAYRRTVFDRVGTFDPALDVGTVTGGGGDLEMFFRVVNAGHTLVYEPRALVRHHHRREYAHLRTQLHGWGTGLAAYIASGLQSYPDERLAFGRLALWWLKEWVAPRLIPALIRPANPVRDLALAELRGSLVGLSRYRQARRTAARISETFGPLPGAARADQARRPALGDPSAIAVRSVDLGWPFPELTNLDAYEHTRVYVTSFGAAVGSVEIPNRGRPVGRTRLREIIASSLGLRLLERESSLSPPVVEAKALAALAEQYLTGPGPRPVRTSLPPDVPVSVVVATRDRPKDLHACLRSLTAQESRRRVEIVVVDNNPSSGLTPPVVSEFPSVIMVDEPRQGLSYARNAGFAASTGDIAVTTDDDVVAPPDWLEKLIAPMARSDVMVVTGLTLPLELETPAQQAFEAYGGLGRGFERHEVNGDWFASYRFRAVPTWLLGGTANAAVRARVFDDPTIRLLHEALGSGMPAGVGEDTYLFYKVLKAGHTVAYEPSAYVWHKHRRALSGLRRQIYDYSRGHVAYHLTTLTCDGDLRALVRLAVELPHAYVWRLSQCLLGRSVYPLPLILLEIAGILAGPWAFWQSRRMVKRYGRSRPYIPPAQRAATLRIETSLVGEADGV